MNVNKDLRETVVKIYEFTFKLGENPNTAKYIIKPGSRKEKRKKLLFIIINVGYLEVSPFVFQFTWLFIYKTYFYYLILWLPHCNEIM